MSAPEKRATLSTFLGLFALGMIGVLSLALTLAPVLDLRPHEEPGALSRSTLLIMTLIQPTLLLALGVAAGCAFAPRLGLTSLIDRSRPLNRLRRCAPISLRWGVAIAVVITLADVFIFRAYLDDATIRTLQQGGIASTLAGMLYGGLTEEIIARWGLVSLLAWLGWRVFQRDRARASPIVFVIAIILAALLFAAGHLPAAMALNEFSAPLATRVLVLNTIAGIIFGGLFWRHNLETAMLSHASVHAALAAVALTGWS